MPTEPTSARAAPPTLPFELLALIVDCAAQTPSFDFLQPEWSQHVPTQTLHALCLTSHAFNELATPRLYSHVTLPTAAAGEAFRRTLESERWHTGARAGKTGKWVQAVACGKPSEPEGRMTGDGVCGVLAVLREQGARVERVAVSGVELGVQAFAEMQGERSKLQCDGESLLADTSWLAIAYSCRLPAALARVAQLPPLGSRAPPQPYPPPPRRHSPDRQFPVPHRRRRRPPRPHPPRLP